MAARDDQVLMERISGSTLAEIGKRHALSPEGVRLVVTREARRQIDDLELRLMANMKTDDVELFVVPGHSGPDFDLAMAHISFALRELDARGIDVQVDYRPVHNGLVLGLQIAGFRRQEAQHEFHT